MAEADIKRITDKLAKAGITRQDLARAMAQAAGEPGAWNRYSQQIRQARLPEGHQNRRPAPKGWATVAAALVAERLTQLEAAGALLAEINSGD